RREAGAGRGSTRAQVDKGWPGGETDVADPCATRRERAAVGDAFVTRDRTRNRKELRELPVDARLRQEQAERVWMQRFCLELLRRCDLEQRPRIEHVDAIAAFEG